MKKIFAILMLAATVAACTLQEDLTPAQPETPQTYAMTVKAAKGVDTKALYFGADGKLNAKWKDGEEKETVIVKEGDTKLGTLTAYPDPVDPTQATLKGNLETAPSASGVTLTLVFNSADGYSSQNGTLSYIESHTDYATAETTVTINGNNVTGTSASFVNQNAIVKFTLKDKSNSSVVLTPEKFKVSVMYNFTIQSPKGGTLLLPMELKNYEFTISPSAYSSEEKALYFALPLKSYVEDKAKEAIENSYYSSYINIAEALESIYLVVSATDGGDTYIYTRTDPGYPFLESKYYSITVKMTKQYRSMDKATTNDIGKVIGADGKIYINADEAEAAQTTAEAMIAYVGAIDNVCTHGLAIALSDFSQENPEKPDQPFKTYQWETSTTAAASTTPITDGTWRLPTDKDWQYMFWGAYYDTPSVTNISAFNSKLRTAGGTVLVSNSYWTNTSIDDENAKAILHDGEFVSFRSLAKTGYWYVRACLAF